jgi:hypothetical protein
MSKLTIPFVSGGKDKNGNKTGRKTLSHGSNRCKRHPSSKRCTNGSMK